jgi:hypothetical protein
MRLRRSVRVSLMLAVGLTLAACSSSSTSSPASSPGPSSTTVATHPEPDRTTVLTTGKSDLELPPGTYRSPAGFGPPLQITVTGSGWRSTHRGSDGFDLSRPDPTKDAPLVALVIVTPPESDAAAAFAALRVLASSAGATTKRSTMTVAGSDASVLDVSDGQGQLVTSARHGIALDAGAGPRMRVVAMEVDGDPVVAAIFVPDETRWEDGLEAALPLLSSISSA